MAMQVYEDLESDGDTDRDVVMLLLVSGRLFQRLVCFPVIVERWEHRNTFSLRRALQREFTEAERQRLERWGKLFREWHCRTGLPDYVRLRSETLELLQRFVHVFATVN